MKPGLAGAGLLGCALLATTAPTAPAAAQTVNPRFSQVDANGVDLVTGQFNYAVTEGTIGSGPGALTLSRIVAGSNAASEWTGLLYRRTTGATTLVYVEFGPIAETFTVSGSTYTSTLTNGGTPARARWSARSAPIRTAPAASSTARYARPTTAAAGRPTSNMAMSTASPIPTGPR